MISGKTITRLVSKNTAVCIILAAGYGFAGAANGPVQIQSGSYWHNGATIAFDGKYLTGIIDNNLNERFSCQFFFSGKVNGNSFTIICRNFEDTGTVSGTITVLDSTRLFLKTRGNPACSDMIASFEERGDTLSVDSLRDIRQIRIIRKEKAFFYASPDSSTRKKAYLVKGDQATVIQVKNSWFKVTYGKTTGWMQEKDLYPID